MVFRCILDPSQGKIVMRELHCGTVGGHEITSRKIFDAGYWWPTMYKDVLEYYRSNDWCQRAGSMANKGMA
jgi:hypothetical protein